MMTVEISVDEFLVIYILISKVRSILQKYI